jgi:hypothetical protein
MDLSSVDIVRFGNGYNVIGICYLPLDIWHRGFLTLGFFFSVASSFTLAKTIRDNQEASSAKSTLGAEPYRS